MTERLYDQIVVDTVDEADLFLPGMHVLCGETNDNWVVERIDAQSNGEVVISLYRD